MRTAVGVDIGGTGIKAGVVDLDSGVLLGERVRVETPQPALPDAVLRVTAELVAGLGAVEGPVGVGLPSAIVGGRAVTAAHLDESWIGEDVTDRFSDAIGRECTLLNDADAAGLAEMRHGAGLGVAGVVLLLTLGTGIGSGLFVDGRLVPNTEFGHIEIRGKDGELRASATARERKGLSYAAWVPLLNEYLDAIDALVWPDLIIIGGGISKKADRFLPLLRVRPPIVAAKLRNEAGIVGAAIRAAERQGAVAPARQTGSGPR